MKWKLSGRKPFRRNIIKQNAVIRFKWKSTDQINLSANEGTVQYTLAFACDLKLEGNLSKARADVSYCFN